MAENYLNILAETIRNNWDQPALADFYLTEDGKAQDTSRGSHYTYGEMYAEIVSVADLLTNLGLQKGDHIAICGANSAHWAIAYLAIAKMQGVSVTVMHTLQPDEIAHLVDFSDAEALFVDKEIWDELKEHSFLQVKSVINLDDWSILYGEKQSINHKSSSINEECGFPHSEPDSLAMICFTSGTSGRAKGVMLPYRSLSNNVNIFNQRYANDYKRNYVIFLPLAHMAALATELLPQLLRSKYLFIYRGNPLKFCIYKSITIVKPYMMTEVPQVITTLGQEYGYAFLTNLSQLLIGGAVLSKKEEEKMVLRNVPLIIMYGQSEVGAAISLSKHNEHRLFSSGTILENMTCRIAPSGEILVKGENLMLGYYKDPEATAQKIDKDGWLHTGDKGHLDEDGYLYVEGRLEQDIIVLPNGENIRPDNIEALINALPEVKESIVLARDGKLVARVVVPSSLPFREESEVGSLRRMILRQVNPQLPLFSQLYDVEITDQPLARTEKQTLKRYLYK